ncbi:uncharacterized protein LOC114252416 [Bombyx mandarina]|uniref:Uncharacterized protein n=2 Tax=Bombyx TaxID=7090 RepID=A0A8R2M5T3_BOMMO|nr:uncharacterized protein LOC114252416 [Bombyx mandarina]XP_037875336.1 uncharacterized protein LOC119630345 [Bombyx mori]
MPKYYRFRATSPTRRPKRCRDKEREREAEKFNVNTELNNWLDVTLACQPAPNWYMRRTAWRESPPLMGVPRQLAAGLRASVQLTNRPIFIFKIPSVRSQDWLSLL